MSKSLQEQLLKAGLVSTEQVKKANAAKAKNTKQHRHKKSKPEDQTLLEVEQKAVEKAKRDLALNRKREDEKHRREIEAQIKQLADQNAITEDEAGEAFHFEHKGVVKKVYVSDSVRLQLINGQLGIVISGRRYRVVPADVAKKIEIRDKSALVLLQLSTGSREPEVIEPAYAEYKIPDDLIW